MNSAIAQYMIDNLSDLNLQFYQQHIAKPEVKVGSFGVCGNCGREDFIRYIYGTKPLCRLCADEIVGH